MANRQSVEVELIIPKKGIIIPKMGVKNTSLGEVLFTKTQRRVLGLLFGNPDQSYYANEVVRFAGAGIGTVQRELQRLESSGLITATKIGNQKHYQANREAAIFEELRGIVLKTFGVADHLREALAPVVNRIWVAFVYGSVAKSADTARSDIDVMIISDDIGYPEVIQALSKAEEEVRRPINPSVYGLEEWRRKVAEDKGFVKRVLEQPKVFLVGSDNDLGKPR